MNRRLSGLVLAIGLLVPRAAGAQDAIDRILALYDKYDVVALDDGDHGNIQAHEFRLRLIRDPRFVARVDDIVIEFGNARYQSVADRYVNGDAVAPADLRLVWRDTSQAGAVWDSTIYEEFFKVIRAVNAASAGHRLRILLGDPPIDWTGVESFADLTKQMRAVGDRDTHPSRLIEREVIAKGRRALVVYGGVHLQRMPAPLKKPCDPAAVIPCFPGSIVDQLMRGRALFNIHTLTAASDEIVAALSARLAPQLLTLAESDLGNHLYREFQPAIPMLGPDGKPQPEAPIRTMPMKDVFDALLYIGPPASMTTARIAPEVCAEAEYVAMRKHRMALVAPPGAPLPALCGR